MTHQPTETPQFYLTAPAPCPYLPGRAERKVFTHLVGDRAAALNDILTQGGFRRSQNIAYRPACEGCRSCISVRTVVADFKPTASMTRIFRRNEDVVGAATTASPSSEQYSLFRRYLDARHVGARLRHDGRRLLRLDQRLRIPLPRPRQRHYRAGRRPAHRHGADRRPRRRPVDGLLLLRSRPLRAQPRHVHDPRSHPPCPEDGPALRLSGLLGRWVAEDGL